MSDYQGAVVKSGADHVLAGAGDWRLHAKAGRHPRNCDPHRGYDRLTAYAVAGCDVLLVFRKGATGETVRLTSGTIPGHGGDGALHVAFAISKDELDRWETHLAAHGVAIEGRNDWERGGRSVYFRDPDGHLLELRRMS